MTAVEWLQDALSIHLSFEQHMQFEGLFQQSKEMEKQNIIDILEFLTNEKSEFSIMYGNQEKRFASNDKDYTIDEILEIYKKQL
jgi:hypothetical protein